jgi:ketosteroid isomerase-like protein
MASEAQTDPASVARAFIDAENRHDVEGAVALFADDAVVVDARGTLTTRAEIRQWQTDLAAGNFAATMGAPTVVGDRVTFGGDVALNSLRALGFDRLDATWELTIQQGRIKGYRFAFTPEANARFQQSVARTAELARTGGDAPALVELGALALALGALLLTMGRGHGGRRS